MRNSSSLAIVLVVIGIGSLLGAFLYEGYSLRSNGQFRSKLVQRVSSDLLFQWKGMYWVHRMRGSGVHTTVHVRME
jgi:hypothetical protein